MTYATLYTRHIDDSNIVIIIAFSQCWPPAKNLATSIAELPTIWKIMLDCVSTKE